MKINVNFKNNTEIKSPEANTNKNTPEFLNKNIEASSSSALDSQGRAFVNLQQTSFKCKQNFNADNDLYSSNQKIISELKHQTARNFFDELNQKSPAKCSILLNNECIIKYSDNEYGIFSDENKFSQKEEELNLFKKSIDNINEEDIKNIINTLSARENMPTPYWGKSIISGCILYANDPKAYDYIVNSPVVDEKYVNTVYSKDLCMYILDRVDPTILDKIDYNSVIEIEKGLNDNFNYEEYTINSDRFLNSPAEAEEMQNHLSQCISGHDVTAYRGEKSSWVFETIPIDKKMQNKVRMLTFLNPNSRKDLIYPNNQKYSDVPEETVYDYINKKNDELTLADAMLVAKYGDKKFVKQIIDKINCSSVEDSNFKSFTLKKKFAENWANTKNGSTDNNMISIVTKTNIKKGNQVGYYARSGQYEFIVNNNRKKMTFDNAQYDKKTNTFYVDSEIEAL